MNRAPGKKSPARRARRRPGRLDPLVYEVRLTVEPGIRREFDRWLDGHVREMIALPGFYDARILHADANPDGWLRRIVRYRLRDRDALDRYLQHDAPRMREDGVSRFGDRFRAERDVYAPIQSDEDEGERRCPNCGSVAGDNYCPVCGQEQKPVHVSFWRLVQDFFGELFTFDSRFIRSMRPLLARPGFLTREYFEGRRARYIPPLRLYLFISIIFFTFLSLILPGAGEITFSGDTPPAAQEALERAAEAERRAAAATGARETSPEVDITGIRIFGEKFDRQLQQKGQKVAASPMEFVGYLIENMPIAMFLLLPVYALVLRVLYPLAGFVYVEHLIFALHVHAFTFVLLTVQLITNSAASAYAPSATIWPFETAITFYLLIYPWIAMRRTYRQGILLTTLKYLLQAVIYFTLLIVALTGAAVATIYWF